jgi:hypothetical protein
MREKIRVYVEHQFRFKKDEATKELIEEIVANLEDTFDAIKIKNENDELAYIETIKKMGDFHQSDEKPKEVIKPSLIDTFLVISVILSIFGLLLVFFNVLIAFFITTTSIILYAASSNHLYQLAEFAKNKEMDIEKHNIHLKKIFRFMKTNFIYWAISLVLIISIIPTNLITGLSIYFTFGNLSSLDVDYMVKTALIVTIITFVISGTLITVFFIHLYKLLNDKYHELTGETTIKSYIKGLNLKFNFRKLLFSPLSVLIISAIIFIFLGSTYVEESSIISTFPILYRIDKYYVFYHFTDNIFLTLWFLLSLIIIVINFLFVIKPKKSHHVNLISIFLIFILIFLCSEGAYEFYISSSNNYTSYSFFQSQISAIFNTFYFLLYIIFYYIPKLKKK